jgi:predicted small secreted protein
MKTANIQIWAVLTACVLCLSACTAVEDAGDDVSRKFEDGITGQGRLVSPSETGDQFGSYYQ